MSRQYRVYLIILLVLAVGVLGSAPAPAALEGKTVKLGAVLPLTGRGAPTGQGNKLGMDIAVEEINAAGGIGGKPIEIVLYDSAGKNEEGAAATRRLITGDNVLAIIGPCLSGVAEVSFPVTNRLKTPSIAVCSAKPGVAEKNRPWAFRNTTISTALYEHGIRLWAEKYKIKKAAVIYDARDAFSKADGTIVFPIMAKKAGLEIVDSVSFQTGDLDYSGQVTKIKNLGVQGMLIAGLVNEAAGIVREAKRQNLNIRIFGGGDLSSGKFIDLAGKDAVEGIYSVTAFWVNSPDPRAQAFLKKFRPRYNNVDPHFTAAQAYDVVYMLKQVIESEKVTNKPEDLEKDRDRIRIGLEKIKNFPGLSGVTTMTPTGDVQKKILVLVVRKGQYELVEGQ